MTSMPSVPCARSTVDCRISRPSRRRELGERLGVKPTRGEAKHPYIEFAVSLSASRRMSSCCLTAGLRSDLIMFFTSAAPLHELAEFTCGSTAALGPPGPPAGGSGSATGGGGALGVLRILHPRASDGREADVVLLDDARVQRVEVEHEHVLIVEALLWAPGRGRPAYAGPPFFFPALTPPPSSGSPPSAPSKSSPPVFPRPNLRSFALSLSGSMNFLAWNSCRRRYSTRCARVLQGLGPEVARDVRELPREREDGEVEEQTEGEPRVVLGRLGQLSRSCALANFAGTSALGTSCLVILSWFRARAVRV